MTGLERNADVVRVSTPDAPAGQNYDLNMKAAKQSGREGLLVAAGARNSGNYYWWNLGGPCGTPGLADRSAVSPRPSTDATAYLAHDNGRLVVARPGGGRAERMRATFHLE